MLVLRKNVFTPCLQSPSVWNTPCLRLLHRHTFSNTIHECVLSWAHTPCGGEGDPSHNPFP